MNASRGDEATALRGRLRVGDVIDGRYELRRGLGAGAGGVVFEAVHRFTGRTVALKMVVPDAEVARAAELKARLVREARALAASRHPGIVEVLDGGFVEGAPYFVMEKLDGRTLEGLLAARTRLSEKETAAVMFQVCDALDVAHRAGVVHRDLKPDNIFVVRERDGRERVKVADFGAAQMAHPVDEKLSAMGAILGTPTYMAPEQLLAEEDIDARADVYALGVTMFECLTGTLPYEGSYPQILMQVCSEAPPPSVLTRPFNVSKQLAAVVERAIAKRRSLRFGGVVELAQAIHAALPDARDQITFLGPPPLPRFAAAQAPAAAPSNDPAQRRRAPRAPYVTPVHVVLAGGSSVDGRSEDVSEGGLLVVTRQACTAGQRVRVRFAVPIEEHVVSCEADLRWVRAARPDLADSARAMGLEFVDLPEGVRASIRRYVEAMGAAVG